MKHYLINPVYRAIDKMLEGHYFKLNKDDERILTEAIDETVDDVTNYLHIGEKVESEIKDHLPDLDTVREETQAVMRRHHHR